MRSIFEIHDGDEIPGTYEVPGTNLTVVVEVIYGVRFWIERGAELDSKLTGRAVHSFRGHPTNRATMQELGTFLLASEGESA